MSIRLIRPIGPIGPMRLIGPMLLMLLALISCDRYELEQYYTGKAKVRVNVDWMSHFGERPSGMTIMLAKDGDAITFSDITHDVDGYDLDLEPGYYKMLIFNRTSGEYGSMGFNQMKSFEQAYAYAQQQQRSPDFWDVNTSYMREPEDIGCAVDTFTILPEMVDDRFRFVNWKDKGGDQVDTVNIQEVVDPMTTEMYIRVRVIGIKYMASVIGNISGMANGFLLTQAWRRPQRGYHLLDNWQCSPITYEDADSLKSVGYITTTIRTFGLPHGNEMIEQRDSTSNVLSLCFTLIDDTRHVFRYPVGKMIRYRNTDTDPSTPSNTRGGFYFSKSDVTLELDLIVDAPFYNDDEVPNLPYAQPSGTGAFDADVEPWGDEEIIDIPM
ncbi:MAG: DUF5119 domain-containing protein [Bacteroidaceae bacterium]|nr:DUF5119 domain-containing protein [Bacteroidaceae bacterium]